MNKLSPECMNSITKAPVLKTADTVVLPVNDKKSRLLERVLKTGYEEVVSGQYRVKLYRFLSDQIPVINACLNTWVRLSAAPGEFQLAKENAKAKRILDGLSNRLYAGAVGKPGGMTTFLARLFTELYRDGLFGGVVLLDERGDSIKTFLPLENEKIRFDHSRGLYLEHNDRIYNLTTSDCFCLTHQADNSYPLGQSIFKTIPFVAYIEQQLVEDMRRASHNSGYHKLHVKITPPERIGGESDNAYVSRMNEYFDATVDMIKGIEIDENPVTWDNIEITAVGPENVRAVTNSWFLNHRAMIEEVCAGTNLAPFLLGYSFGATSTWASFKFDLVMRQVRSVQAEVASFLSWLGNIELALAGVDNSCRFIFDNNFAYQAGEASTIKSMEITDILKVYEAGLLDKKTAQERLGGLL